MATEASFSSPATLPKAPNNPLALNEATGLSVGRNGQTSLSLVGETLADAAKLIHDRSGSLSGGVTRTEDGRVVRVTKRISCPVVDLVEELYAELLVTV